MTPLESTAKSVLPGPDSEYVSLPFAPASLSVALTYVESTDAIKKLNKTFSKQFEEQLEYF